METGPSVPLNVCPALCGEHSLGVVPGILSSAARLWLCDQEKGGLQGAEGRESPELWDPG